MLLACALVDNVSHYAFELLGHGRPSWRLKVTELLISILSMLIVSILLSSCTHDDHNGRLWCWESDMQALYVFTHVKWGSFSCWPIQCEVLHITHQVNIVIFLNVVLVMSGYGAYCGGQHGCLYSSHNSVLSYLQSNKFPCSHMVFPCSQYICSCVHIYTFLCEHTTFMCFDFNFPTFPKAYNMFRCPLNVFPYAQYRHFHILRLPKVPNV